MAIKNRINALAEHFIMRYTDNKQGFVNFLLKRNVSSLWQVGLKESVISYSLK